MISAPKLTVALLVIILLISLFLRLPSFFTPHNHGDQLQYLALAMKLETFGFHGYSLRGVDLFRTKNGYYMGVIPARKGRKGSFLQTVPAYYDEPLFHKPPLFAYALMISHKLLDRQRPYVALNVASRFRFGEIKSSLAAQFYCAFIPVLFSLLLIAATFFLGKTLFSDKAGLYAAALLSMSPIELLSSQRIWADNMLAFFVIAALILYYLASDKENLVLAILAGVAAGVAILTKPSGNILILIIPAYELYKKRILNKRLAVFLVTCGLIAIPWHWLIWKTYGSLFYMPMSTQPELIHHPWFKMVLNRPWFMYFVNVPVQTPLLLFVYPAIFTTFKNWNDKKREPQRNKKIFLSIWIAMFLAAFLLFKVGRELRYILPAYPAIAILSGQALGAIEEKLAGKFGSRIASGIAITAIVLCAFWSAGVGLSYVFRNLALIKLPL